ncbi:DUF6414 family protein [Bacillus sonorensis]|uniref:DUF6414 family protein n=1 Tax=Bacillus sonorensis TaxID=119858 RepID=UPI002281B288|nr:hypothetical protein [Bacillus sonorensis]MCY8565639.1 hypothetical protein [Bacillus sonorensis]MEC1437295.1 hypothetical protein [Bacillus sonorensis]
MNNNLLPITSYLNQKIVFDLLAVIEDGFAQVTNISSASGKDEKTNFEGNAEIGIKNVFGLLGFKGNGGYSKAKSEENTDSFSEERVHTPTSLFSRLYSYLEEEGYIKEISNREDLNVLSPGNFVEFRSTLQQNPLVSLLESMEQILVTYIRLEGTTKKGKKNEESDILKQIKNMKSSLIQNETIDLICSIDKDLKAVAPIYMDFFYNRNMNEVIDGEYTVLGKVVKVVNDESSSGINLFRNTGFKLMKQDFLTDMFDKFELEANDQLDIPEITTIVKNPALLVIPIAIYT